MNSDKKHVRDNLERIRMNLHFINNFIEKDSATYYEGCADSNKLVENIRLLALNIKGLNP